MDPSSNAVAAHGTLAIALPANQANLGLRGTAVFDLTHGFVQVAIARYLPASAASEFELVVRRDETSQFFLGIENETFVLRVLAEGDPRVMTPPVDRSARWWRIRHDVDTGDIVMEIAAQPNVWTTLRRDPPPFPIDAMTVQLEADAYDGSVPQPSSVELDDLVVASPSCDRSEHDLRP
jgi:hypothetical protein